MHRERTSTNNKMESSIERCASCNKKVVLLVDCECGKHFCVKHRHHDCQVRRQKELEQLKKNMPVIAPDKLVDKI